MWFRYGLKELGNSIGISDLEFRLLPLPQKIERGFLTLAELSREYVTLDIELQKTPNKFSWQVNRCPLCWQRVVDEPCCQLAVGLFQEALFWISGGKTYMVEETSCIAAGDPACTFEISRVPLD